MVMDELGDRRRDRRLGWKQAGSGSEAGEQSGGEGMMLCLAKPLQGCSALYFGWDGVCRPRRLLRRHRFPARDARSLWTLLHS